MSAILRLGGPPKWAAREDVPEEARPFERSTPVGKKHGWKETRDTPVGKKHETRPLESSTPVGKKHACLNARDRLRKRPGMLGTVSGQNARYRLRAEARVLECSGPAQDLKPVPKPVL